MLSSESLQAKAKPWLTFLDELQDLNIAHQQLSVPQIAVFGDQSSGKSSLLESISGIPFPKGTGLVTKCPTRITMTNTSHSSSSGNSNTNSNTPSGWQARISLPSHIDISSHPDISRIVHIPSELSSLLAEASNLITAHSQNGFSKDAIHVHVQSPDTPDLTLVDLPGIIRTTTAGQDRSVIAEVDSLLSFYMSQEETVILAVIPANQDIATVDILERAHRHDPQGERTIGVLTKPDLIDQGAEDEVLIIAKNVRKPLKLGYVMVKNRNQAELKSALSLQDSMSAEEAYFNTHTIWNQLDKSTRGTRSLCDKLTNLIVHRAMDRAPFIKANLVDKKHELDVVLQSLGQDVPLDDDVRRKMLVRLISRFTQTLRQVAQGDYRDALPQQHPALRLKFSINQVLQQLEQSLKHHIPDLNSDVYLVKLKQTMKDMRGRELPGFGSTRLLLSSIAEDLDNWRTQAEEAIGKLFEVYVTVAHDLADKLSLHYPFLHQVILSTVTSILHKYQEDMQLRVEEMFTRSTEGTANDLELIESINQIRFARFEQVLVEVLTVAKEVEPGKGSKDDMKTHCLDMLGHAYMDLHAIKDGPTLQAEEARAVLTAYWKICEKKVNEDITSGIEVVLLQQCSEKIEKELLSDVQLWLADPQQLENIFAEDPKITETRKQSKALKVKIEEALQSLERLILTPASH